MWWFIARWEKVADSLPSVYWADVSVTERTEQRAEWSSDRCTVAGHERPGFFSLLCLRPGVVTKLSCASVSPFHSLIVQTSSFSWQILSLVIYTHTQHPAQGTIIFLGASTVYCNRSTTLNDKNSASQEFSFTFWTSVCASVKGRMKLLTFLCETFCDEWWSMLCKGDMILLLLFVLLLNISGAF